MSMLNFVKSSYSVEVGSRSSPNLIYKDYLQNIEQQFLKGRIKLESEGNEKINEQTF